MVVLLLYHCVDTSIGRLKVKFHQTIYTFKLLRFNLKGNLKCGLYQ